MKKIALSRIMKQIIMITMVVIALVPIYYVFVTMFKSPDEYLFNKWGLPLELSLENFKRLMEGETIFRWLINSLIISGFSVLISILVASMMGFAIARFDFPGKSALFVAVTSLLVLSPAVLVIPLFKSMVKLGLINTYYSAIIIYTGIMLPISTYLLTNFFKSIHNDIIDAALIDGCSLFQIYYRIMIPLSMPAIVTAALTNWLYVWNEILIGLIFLQSDKMRTLMPGLSLFKGKYTTNIPLTMAGVAVAIIPTFVIYLMGQRYFVKGLTEGAVK
ncbi:MAG: carbohydrate ABC transporter permease [Candidatus Atribacteria bacterium]|nr:carbohydrate ABC transporter permease [Candidatus Atribacteria bacterium]